MRSQVNDAAPCERGADARFGRTSADEELGPREGPC